MAGYTVIIASTALLAIILLLSDHCMQQLSRDSVIFPDDYLALDDITLLETSPKADLIPHPGKEHIVYPILKRAHPKLWIFYFS